MKIYKNSLYDEFKCLAGECPSTCCYGWRILIDEDTVGKINNLDGLKGFLLKKSLAGPDKNFFNYNCGSCLFHDFHGLCSIQKKLGEDYMPLICRTYPREIRNYEKFAVFNLDLSCIKVSKMLLEKDERPKYIETNGECNKKISSSNDDSQFANIIMDMQKDFRIFLSIKADKMTDIKSLDDKLHVLLSYLKFSQEVCLEHREMLLTGEKNNIKAFEDEFNKNTNSIKISDIRISFDKDMSLFPLPIMALNKLINTNIDREDTRNNAIINKTIEWYHRKFDAKSEIEGQKLWLQMVDEFFREDPFRMEALIRYLLYDIMQCYVQIYENYSFIHYGILSIMHVNMVMFLWINYARKKKLTTYAMAMLLTAYEKGVCHNVGLEKEMYEITCDYINI